jgi:hypothetical protein
MEGFWRAIAPIFGDPFLAAPLAIFIVLAWQSPKLLKVFLTHRRELWKLQEAQQRRLASFAKRRSTSGTNNGQS